MSDLVICWNCHKTKGEDDVDTCENCGQSTCFRCAGKSYCCKAIEQGDDEEFEAFMKSETVYINDIGDE